MKIRHPNPVCFSANFALRYTAHIHTHSMKRLYQIELREWQTIHDMKKWCIIFNSYLIIVKCKLNLHLMSLFCTIVQFHCCHRFRMYTIISWNMKIIGKNILVDIDENQNTVWYMVSHHSQTSWWKHVPNKKKKKQKIRQTRERVRVCYYIHYNFNNPTRARHIVVDGLDILLFIRYLFHLSAFFIFFFGSQSTGLQFKLLFEFDIFYYLKYF